MTAIGRQFRLPNVLETFAEEEEGEDDILPEIQLNSPLTWNCSQKENPIIDLPELRRKDAPNESEYVPVSRRTPSFIGTAHVVDGTFNISRRSSHKAAIMASGGHRRRSTIAKLPFAIQAVPKLKTRARELWSILRKNVLAKKMSHPLGGYLSDLSKSVPYKQILKMGFHYQRSLKHDQTVLMVLSHAYSKSRPGAIGAEAMEQAYQLGIASGNEDTGTSGKTSKVTAIVTVNRTRQLSVWDTHSKKSKWSTTLSSDLKHLIFVSKHAVYAACFLDSHVLFYDMNMELVHKIGVEFSVQFLRYNEHSDTLFVVGLTALSIWPLRDGLFKSKQDSGVESPFPSDLWIADVHYIERTTSILIAVDTNLIIYGLKFHEITDRALNATARKITCVAFHPRYEYILVGSTDGVIKVFNVNLSLVHAFRVHTRSVTGLNIYPQGYLFLSSSLDKTFRLFDLKTMSEVYCNRIIDTSPLSIQMVNDQMFYVHMRDRIELWQARHLHHSLLMSSSPAEKITFVSNQKLGLSRIVVQTSDEIIRILSPVTGKPITMMLPFVQAKELKNLAYSIVSHKMYLLRTTGEIWIVDTKSNPCKLVDIWRQEESAFESMTSLCMFDGRLQSWNTPAGFNKDDGFAMLFGATDTGEVVLFNKSGYIEYRFQIHDGSIIQMSCLTKKQCIATLGTDHTLKISEVMPFTRQLVSTTIIIDIRFNPIMFSLTESHVCVASRENVIHMYQFQLARKEYRSIFGHETTDDHTDVITNITSLPELGLFVSTSKDMTLKLWDLEGALIREVQFQQPLNAISACNAKGDLILGINDRLDIFKGHHYLPPNYIWAVSKMTWKEDVKEDPIDFDANFDPKAQYVSEYEGLITKKPRHIPTDRRTHLEVFDALNILDTDATSREVGKSIACAADESSSQDCNRDEKCSVDKDITSVPVKDNPSLQHRASVRDAHLTSKSRLRTSEFLIRQKQAAELLAKRKEAMELLEKQKALEEDPIKASIISGMMEEISNLNAQILSKKRVTEEGLPVISADQAPLADDTGNITKIGFDPHKLLSGIPVLDGKASTVSETPKAIQTPTKAKKRGRIVVAPDGYLPNSSSSAKIIGLKKKSEDVQIQVARRIFTLQDKIKMANELDNKIKAMEASRNAELEVEVEPVRSRLPKNKPKKKPFRETLKVEEMESLSSSQEGTLPNPLIDQTKNSESKKVTPVSLSHAEVQLEEVIKYPEIVVKVLATDWFPANEILEPESSIVSRQPSDQAAEDETGQAIEKHTRKLTINATAKVIINICLRRMSTATTDIKRRISTFLSNTLTSEERSAASTEIAENYLEQLSSVLTRSTTKDEAEYCTQLIYGYLSHTPDNTDIFPILLLLSVSIQPDLKKTALAILHEMGASRVESPHIVSFLEAVAKEGPKRFPFSFEKQLKFYKNLPLYWLRYHLEAYLLRRSPDDKDINKVIKFDLLTNLDGSVLDMDTRNKVTALIPIKPRKKQDKLDDVNRYELSRVPVHDPLLPEFGFTKAFQYRSTLSIITTPLNVDFAITVNFIALMTDRLLQVQESERLAEAAKVQEVQRKIDEDLLKAEKAKSIKENKDKQALEQDRLKKEKLETAKARVTATREKLRQKKETITAGLALPAVSSQRTTVTPTKKVRHDEKSRHGWHPQDLTQSKCHPSREVWDAAYWNFRKKEEEHRPHQTNSLALHYAAFNKSLVIDHVNLDPFAAQEGRSVPGRRGLSRGGDTRRGVTVSHHHHLFHPPAADVMRLHEYSDEPKHMKDELDYIRQGLPQRTLKKTNLPMISDATSTIDSNLTAVAPEDLLSSRDYETIQDGKQMRSTRRYFMPRLAVAWDSIDASKDLPLEDHRKNT